MKRILPLQLLVQPDRHDPQPLVIYHGRNCPDGFAAALAARLFYSDAAQYVGLDHGDVKTLDDLPAVAGRAVYILDFSFAEDILRGIEAQAAKLVLLDHHQSAAEKLTGFACRCGVVHFDMGKSGARLAWEFFHSDASIPDLVRFVEDRDLWNWQYPDSAALMWNATANEKGGVVKVGLRSQRGFDCIPLASSMGGGGHAQACGFKMPAVRLAELLAGSLTA